MPSLLVSFSKIVQALLHNCFESIIVLKVHFVAHWSTLFRQEFHYQPLAANELRVLTVLPPLTTRRDEPIQCSLEHVSLEAFTAEYKDWEKKAGHDSKLRPLKARLAWIEYINSRRPMRPADKGSQLGHEAVPNQAHNAARYTWGDYIALSYCWGSDDNRTFRRIVLNGRFFRVTENLEAALNFVRIPEGLATTTLRCTKLWADAICINQADGGEKIREILRMKDIYGGSMGVFVHLGPEEDDSDHGIDILQRTATEVTQDIDRSQYLLQSRVKPTEADRKDFGALMKVLCRPYWCRLWILQELAMSDESIAIGCGNRKFRFEEVVLATKFVWHNLESFLTILGAQRTDLTALNSSMWVILFMQQLRQLSRRLEDAQCTTYTHLQMLLLNLSQNAQAKMPHDKVFGLLAIMPVTIASKMKPYVGCALPTEAVFVAFSKAIIECTGDLDVIFAKSLQQTMTPSWATDWRIAPDRVSLLHDWHIYGYNQFDKAYRSLHQMIDTSRESRADGGRKSRFEILDKSSILACSGVLIGKVDGMASDMPALGALSFSDCEHVQPQHQHNPYGDDKATSRALVHTLFANPVWGDSEHAALLHIPWLSGESYSTDLNHEFSIDDNQKENFQQMHQDGWGFIFSYGNFFSFELFRRRLGRFRIGGKRFQDYFDQEIVECLLPQDRIYLDLAKVVGGHLGRRLITLTTGHFGLAPNTIKPDDVIYIILSCSLPVVLRPVAGTCHFRVVGECYIEGFSRGEAIMGLDKGKYRLQKISLY